MTSADGEYVEFTHPVLLDGPVEAWLCDVERTMRWTLKVRILLKIKIDYYTRQHFSHYLKK